MIPHRQKRMKNEWPLVPGVTLSVPVVQAPLGSCDGPRLAAEVSRAGGLGCLSLFNHTPATARRLVKQVCTRTRRPFLLALTNQWEPESVLDACLEGGAWLFQVFWWNGPRLAQRIHDARGIVFWQVGSVEQAQDAVQTGADVLVVQGTEAGGQVRGGVPLAELIPAIREITSLPIIAGGGLADRADVTRVLAMGANAVMLGTRFLCTEESRAATTFKARLLRATQNDLYLDTRVMGSWPCAPLRRLRTHAANANDEPAYYAGLGIDRIRSLRPAADVVRSLAPD